MATTINIDGKQITATVNQQELIANFSTPNYISSSNPSPLITTASSPESILTINANEVYASGTPTTIRSRSEADQINITDSVVQLVNFARTLIEPIPVTETFISSVQFKRALSHTFRIFQETTSIKVNSLKTDQINVNGKIIAKSVRPGVVDTVNVNGKLVAKSFKLSTSVDFANVLEKIYLTPKPLKTDSSIFTDNFTRVLNWYRTFTDNIRITDDYLGNANIDDDQYATFIKSISINVNAQEFAAKQIKVVNIDQINIADNSLKTTTLQKTNSWTATDQFSKQVSYIRAQTDPVNAGENNLKTISKFSVDSNNITDTNFNSIKLLKSDAISYPLETITKSINSSYSERNNISEYIGKSINNLFTETIQLSDTPAKSTSLLKTDLVNIEDSFTRTVDYLRIFEENDAVNYLVLENLLDYLLLESGDFLTTETYGAVRYPVILLNDPAVSFNSSIFKTDASQVTDSILAIRYIAYAISQADLLNITDSAVFLNIGLLSTSAANTTEIVYSVTNKTLIDQINITDDYLGLANIDDDQYASFGKSTIDTISIIELISKNISSNLQTDQNNVQDNSTITANSVSTDSGNVSNQSTRSIQPSISIATNVSETLVKNIGIISSDISNVIETKYLNISIAKADSFNVTDVTPVKNITSVNIDTTNTTETIYNSASKTLLDIINSSDSLYINSGLALTIQGNVQDTTSIATSLISIDSSTANDRSTSSIQPSISIATNISEILIKNINIVSSNTSNVIETTYFNISIPKLDSFNITDTTPVKDITSVSIDTTNTTETIYNSASKALLDIINSSDSLYINSGLALTTQIINITDSITVTRVGIITSAQSDLINTIDTLFKNIGLSLNLDTVNITDNFITAVNYLQTFEEFAPSDYLVLENLSDYLLLENGDFLITQSYPLLTLNDFNTNFTINTIKSDINNALDTPLKNIGKLVSDITNARDSFIFNYLKTLTDRINTTDDYLGVANIDDDQYASFNKRIIDQVNFAETSYKATAKILQDTINISNPVYLNTNTLKADTTNFAETITTVKLSSQSLLDTINVSNSGTAYWQGYFVDPFYVEPAYTGSLTTFT